MTRSIRGLVMIPTKYLKSLHEVNAPALGSATIQTMGLTVNATLEMVCYVSPYHVSTLAAPWTLPLYACKTEVQPLVVVVMVVVFYPFPFNLTRNAANELEALLLAVLSAVVVLSKAR